ncbi:uncharacterized protein LOC111115561 isoform X1 [Crassostrea virginica]
MALIQAEDLSVVSYSIKKVFPLSFPANIVDITLIRRGYYSNVIGISVANRSSACYAISTDIQYISNEARFVVYNPDSNCISYGNGTAVFCSSTYIDESGRITSSEGGEVWPSGPRKSPLDTRFSPQGIAVCKSGDILISLWNNEIADRSIGKVISMTNTFQLAGGFEIFMDKNRPLLVCPTYLKENGNGDICVSDVGAVVVTDAGGMLRFQYQGTSRNSNFEPYGLCCDTACNIIIADMNNNKIHVIDKDGSFLHYLWYEGIKMPRALCIDENDNVYVGEWNTSSIKVISR